MRRVINKSETRRADPCKLTPYEQMLWDLKQQGMTTKQMAEHLGRKSSNSLSATLKTIREKVEVMAYA